MTASIFGGVHDFFHSATWRRSRARRGRASSCSSGSRRSAGCGRTRGAGSQHAVPDRARDADRRDPAVPRPADLHALPAARVPRGRPRAGARDQGDRAPARRPRADVLGLRLRGRAGLPRLPGLHDEAPAGRARAASRPLEPAWQVCPYCETPVAGRRSRCALRGRRRAQRSASPHAATQVRR